MLRPFHSEHAEAAFIAMEIKRLVANLGGTLGWGDFAVLREFSFLSHVVHTNVLIRFHVFRKVRFNALSRAVESALQKEGIPSRVLGGHKFFDRLEVCFFITSDLRGC